ncbi:helix-turn-helix transcriptional regulator [Conexibacter sp. SYSU D00693]|uniref:helix-turn-helix transcriptional regulator n=1 Tax=Conexibacter sp. SYSU D00693 TaxID=2812560 RepID=UPI00196B8C9D|nr:helix-turn-helix transcriptional regulator [Conexibacter sp. SYSU D00693]
MSANHELREFLRSRRARRTPDEVGMAPGPGHRRVPGLRREEVAQLAGVSVDYYVRLEQGRASSVSTDVLEAIARALCLDEAERAHLLHLAKPVLARRRGPDPGGQRVRPGVQLLLDTLRTPAFVLGRRTDVLATNAMARALLCDFDALEPRERNHARWVFLNPVARERYVDWEAVARDNVAALRLDAGRFPDDAVLNELIGELSVKSREFAAWWAQHDVVRLAHGTKGYRHPVAGDVEVQYEALDLPADQDQTLFVYSAPEGSASAKGLDLLASWIAEPAGPGLLTT